MDTPDGYMSSQLMRPGPNQVCLGDWFRGAGEKIKDEAQGYVAYSGPFRTGWGRQAAGCEDRGRHTQLEHGGSYSYLTWKRAEPNS